MNVCALHDIHRVHRSLSCNILPSHIFFFFFFNDTATTEIYTLSLHDALPIYAGHLALLPDHAGTAFVPDRPFATGERDRKSTRLNSSHLVISYAVFCLKKKKNTQAET